MTELRGRVALITGAGSGVGRATSVRLAQEGVVVGLLGRSLDRLEETAAEVRRVGEQPHVVPADVADADAVAVAFDTLTQQAGGLDILIHSAGIGLYGPVETYSLEDWHQTFATNVTGLFLCAQAALPLLHSRGGGHIIAISSGAGRRGYANLAAYAASKFAVHGFMESLAEEVGASGIKCSTILPGSILTEFGPSTLGEKRASDKKYLLPEDVAEAILQVLRQPSHAWMQQINLWPF